MRRNLPNQLTMMRLILAIVFFVVLSQYRYGVGPNWTLWTAMGIFIVAALTDFLDGYLARRWEVESTFGRIMDPLCDKVLVLGAYIFLAGPRFVDTARTVPDAGFWSNIVPGNMASGVYPWMVALILARELLVTGIRGELEAEGIQFGANWSGKAKLIVQTVGLPWIIGAVAIDPHAPGHEWAAIMITCIVYATVIITVISGVPYVIEARRALRNKANQPTLEKEQGAGRATKQKVDEQADQQES